MVLLRFEFDCGLAELRKRGGNLHRATVETRRTQGQPSGSYYRFISKIRMADFPELSQLLSGDQ
jgi:hypothetical protein